MLDVVEAKISVIGDEEVGCSSLLLRYLNGQFPVDTQPTERLTVMDKQVFFRNKTLLLHLWEMGSGGLGMDCSHFLPNGWLPPSIIFLFDPFYFLPPSP